MKSAVSGRFVQAYAEKINIDKLRAATMLCKNYENKNGFYFLYNNDKLYYIGIAEDVLKRIKDHTRDRHKEKWDTFSFYVTEKIGHAKETETVIQRNVFLGGNIKVGRLKMSENLTSKIRGLYSYKQELRL